MLNKLNIRNLCLIGDKYKQLKDIDKNVAKRLQRLPGYDTLRVALAQKIILVEGPSDELVLKKVYYEKYNILPEQAGIDIIVVRGIGFKNYLEIAKHIGTAVNVVKDNDGNHQKNIIDYAAKYEDFDFINFFSPKNDNLNSLEPALIASNNSTQANLDAYAKVTLSTRTFNRYREKCNDLDEKQAFLKKWYGGNGEDHGAKKVDSAIRVFDSETKIKYPDYLIEALSFE